MSTFDVTKGGRVVRSGIDYLAPVDLETIVAQRSAADDEHRSGIEVLDGRKLRKKSAARDIPSETAMPAAPRPGAFVAPQAEPGYEAIVPALVADGPSPANGLGSALPSYQAVEPVRPFYYEFGEWLMWRSPRLFRLLQGGRRRLARVPLAFGGQPRGPGRTPLRERAPMLFRAAQLGEWILRAGWRNKGVALLFLLVFGALVAVPFWAPEAWPWRLECWLAAALLLAGGISAAILREAFTRLIAAQDRAIARNAKLAREDTRQLARRVGGLEIRLADALKEVAVLRGGPARYAGAGWTGNGNPDARKPAADPLKLVARLSQEIASLEVRTAPRSALVGLRAEIEQLRADLALAQVIARPSSEAAYDDD